MLEVRGCDHAARRKYDADNDDAEPAAKDTNADAMFAKWSLRKLHQLLR